MRKLVVRNDFAVHIQLSDTAAYELRSLRTEIKNNKSFVHAIIFIRLFVQR